MQALLNFKGNNTNTDKELEETNISYPSSLSESSSEESLNEIEKNEKNEKINTSRIEEIIKIKKDMILNQSPPHFIDNFVKTDLKTSVNPFVPPKNNTFNFQSKKQKRKLNELEFKKDRNLYSIINEQQKQKDLFKNREINNLLDKIKLFSHRTTALKLENEYWKYKTSIQKQINEFKIIKNQKDNNPKILLFGYGLMFFVGYMFGYISNQNSPIVTELNNL